MQVLHKFTSCKLYMFFILELGSQYQNCFVILSKLLMVLALCTQQSVLVSVL